MKMIPVRILFLVLAIVFPSSLFAQTCPGNAGCLDLTFGSGGSTQTYIPAVKPLSPGKSAVQSDGKLVQLLLVLPGDSFSNAVVRYNTDGSLDQSFGNGGVVTLNWTSASGVAHAYAIAIETVGVDERVVIAGTGTGYTSSLRVDRFLSNGSPDMSFGNGGTVSITAGAAEAITIQPDGKILTMGTAGALVRLNQNGTFDTSFGNGGFTQNNTWRVESIALQSDGKIVATGYWTNVHGANLMSIWRFNANGSLDDGSKSDSTKNDSFGNKGQVTIDSLNPAWDLKVDGNGKIVVGGSAGSGNTDFAVARLTSAGQLDLTFGVGGKATIDFNGLGDQVRSVSLRSNGQIVLVGFTNTTSANANTGIVRLNSNGSLDGTFGQGGKVASDLSAEGQATIGGLLQFDPLCGCEKLVVPGTVITGGIYYAVAARYLL